MNCKLITRCENYLIEFGSNFNRSSASCFFDEQFLRKKLWSVNHGYRKIILLFHLSRLTCRSQLKTFHFTITSHANSNSLFIKLYSTKAKASQFFRSHLIAIKIKSSLLASYFPCLILAFIFVYTLAEASYLSSQVSENLLKSF